MPKPMFRSNRTNPGDRKEKAAVGWVNMMMMRRRSGGGEAASNKPIVARADAEEEVRGLHEVPHGRRRGRGAQVDPGRVWVELVKDAPACGREEGRRLRRGSAAVSLSRASLLTGCGDGDGQAGGLGEPPEGAAAAGGAGDEEVRQEDRPLRLADTADTAAACDGGAEARRVSSSISQDACKELRGGGAAGWRAQLRDPPRSLLERRGVRGRVIPQLTDGRRRLRGGRGRGEVRRRPRGVDGQHEVDGAALAAAEGEEARGGLSGVVWSEHRAPRRDRREHLGEDAEAAAAVREGVVDARPPALQGGRGRRAGDDDDGDALGEGAGDGVCRGELADAVGDDEGCRAPRGAGEAVGSVSCAELAGAAEGGRLRVAWAATGKGMEGDAGG